MYLWLLHSIRMKNPAWKNNFGMLPQFRWSEALNFTNEGRSLNVGKRTLENRSPGV